MYGQCKLAMEGDNRGGALFELIRLNGWVYIMQGVGEQGGGG